MTIASNVAPWRVVKPQGRPWTCRRCVSLARYAPVLAGHWSHCPSCGEKRPS